MRSEKINELLESAAYQAKQRQSVANLHEGIEEQSNASELIPPKGRNLSEDHVKQLFKVVSLNRVFADRLKEWRKEKQQNLEQLANSEDVLEFQMALIHELVTKENGLK